MAKYAVKFTKRWWMFKDRILAEVWEQIVPEYFESYKARKPYWVVVQEVGFNPSTGECGMRPTIWSAPFYPFNLEQFAPMIRQAWLDQAREKGR